MNIMHVRAASVDTTAGLGGRFEISKTSVNYSALVESISLSSRFGVEAIRLLTFQSVKNWQSICPWFMLWKEHCMRFFDLELADELLKDYMPDTEEHRLFLAQSYCAVLLDLILDKANCKSQAGKPIYSGSLFGWIAIEDISCINEISKNLPPHISTFFEGSGATIKQCSDILASIYQEIMPPALRHLLGEYYTPPWLVDYCIAHAEHARKSATEIVSILDPSVGSGGFLAHYIAELQNQGVELQVELTGFDINPLSILFCKANLLIATSRSQGRALSIVSHMYLSDAVVDPILDGEGPLFCSVKRHQANILGHLVTDDLTLNASVELIVGQFDLLPRVKCLYELSVHHYVSEIFSATRATVSDVIIGNPPWISWDGLSFHYRERVAPQWAMSSLFTSKGWNAKVAAGKTDFSSLFVYRAAERHASTNAIMVFVLPLSLFQSRLSGEGFRSFETAGGRRYPIVSLDDFASVKIFRDAVNRTAVGVFAVDRECSFPILYNYWSSGKADNISCVQTFGGPLNPAIHDSPIVRFEEGCSDLQVLIGKSDYRARGGVNTGGANTILQVHVLADKGSTVTIQNTGKSRRSFSKVITSEVESDVVFPLLCGTDMKRWKSTPSKSILLLYSVEQPKKAISEALVRDHYPKAYGFVSEFRDLLTERKEYHRWGCSGPFFEVYRIGPYTFSPIKVVWQHTGYCKSLNISVIDDRGKKVTIPDQKAIIISCSCLDEAHYICAYLGSSVTADVLNKYLGTDASTHILDYVSLRHYDAKSDDHRELAELSLEAHRLAAIDASTLEIELKINKIVKSLMQISVLFNEETD
ncbi:N-6 DNA methylase [Cyanobium sp. Morenito 9A2]|uniref:N-6 DNA methylase n=1 Tax=Cyanobium sp. Morenito 9A2 TaxID=2823718 RepID=UPI0020CE84FB|nr:N-6 DNA methylase [Cyanobium sp. Morenito 9A2]MCP9849194.1 SAM-dependent DNA methyltransferase [Cyanobium sp. Morenito 9A2]